MGKLSSQITQNLTLYLLARSLNLTFQMNNYSRTSQRNFLAKAVQNRSLVCFINTKKLFKSFKVQLFGKMFSIKKIKKKSNHRSIN